jgi:hypothetical protein
LCDADDIFLLQDMHHHHHLFYQEALPLAIVHFYQPCNQ